MKEATAKVSVLRLKTHEWSEEDFGSLIRDAIDGHEGIKEEVHAAVNRGYRAIAGEEMG